MPIEKSLEAYRNKMNCAQSVLAGFQHLHGISESAIGAARALGGGRAEGGVCGALHAALTLAKIPGTDVVLRQRFREQAGSETCREIRSLKRLRCAECVELAAATLVQMEGAAETAKP